MAGLSYLLEATPNLKPPIPWQPIGTNLANESSLIQFVDADMAWHPHRYYRIKSP